ncbi:hypothetical protein RXV86_21655 [Alisedimentitalea sp. MJ-SS2]|uniref:T4SS efffector SepA family protein n=1 Tax=Aliisedimentitalea sp. MJ-SS2 TaxID=3049795 RepID=UPI002913D430|nr:hypothetical protein [Alisedimentitalea sp. MJ-SS2]MDU8930000.1 hypothetical protein [Alisedimentitalea sp. MJ-SS2]
MKTIEISRTAYSYLKELAVPFEDTPAIVLDRIIAEHSALKSEHPSKSQTHSEASLKLNFGLEDTPNVSFTTISLAHINGRATKAHYWNDILEELLVIASSVAKMEELDKMLNLQFVHGSRVENGYRPVESAGFSFQGVDANRACKSIAILSKTFDIPVTLDISWQHNSKAQYPGQSGTINLP